MQGAKQSKSKKQCVFPSSSQKFLCKKNVKSRSFHHQPHIIIISCFRFPPPSLPAKFPPSPSPWVGMTIRKGTKNAIVCEAVAIARGGVSGSFPAFFLSIAMTSNKIFKSEVIGNWKCRCCEVRGEGHKTGGCCARYLPFSSIKPGTRRAGLTGRFQNPSI
jgi:hypothetical protein